VAEVGGVEPALVGPSAIPVALVHWPTETTVRAALAADGLPRLLLVAADAEPPDDFDDLEDWIRLPADERDIDARLNALRVRARNGGPSAHPELDGHGRLLRGGRWVALSPTEEQLCTLLIGEFGQVVSDRLLLDRAWPGGTGTPTGLRLQMTRLRRRIADLGLEVRSVRGKGYVLQNRAGTPAGAR
jgi:two-component system, OmpR family, response regulator